MLRFMILISGLAAFVSSAHAISGLNGLSSNGISLNRLASNGISLNKLAANGISLNLIAANGISLNGRAANGGMRVISIELPPATPSGK
jgi:hypothetical protein